MIVRAAAAGVLGLALLAGSGGRHATRAAWPVTCTNCAEQLTQVWGWVRQAADMGRSIAQEAAQLNQLVSMGRMLTNIHDPASFVAAMGALGITNPTPINVHAAQALVTGQGGLQAVPWNLQALYTGAGGGQTWMAAGGPTGTWVGNAVQQARNSIAGAFALNGGVQNATAQSNAQLATLVPAALAAGTPATQAQHGLALQGAQVAATNNLTMAVTAGNNFAAAMEQRRQVEEERLRNAATALIEEGRARYGF